PPSRSSAARPAKADSGTRIARNASSMRSDSRVTKRKPYLSSVPVAATALVATPASGSVPDIGLGHVVVDDGNELRGDVLSAQRHLLLAIDEHRRAGRLSRSRQRDADVRMARLARTVHHAAHYG